MKINKKDLTKYGITGDETAHEVGIPNYWVDAIANSKYFAINEKDEEVLSHLKDIKLNLSENKLDYNVEFLFEKNEFFDLEKLTKSYFYDPVTHEPVKCIATNIVWSSPEKNPSFKIKVKKTKSNENYK